MIRSLKLVLVGVSLCSLIACGAPEDASALSSEQAELRAGPTTSFYCGRDDYDFDLSLKLSDDGTKLHVEWGLDNIVTADGAIDPSYRPRPGNANYVRFTGFRGLDDAFGKPPTTTTILVEKPLLQGKAGRAKLQFLEPSGDFAQSDNACFPDE